jgi:hypothetical protein
MLGPPVRAPGQDFHLRSHTSCPAHPSACGLRATSAPRPPRSQPQRQPSHNTLDDRILDTAAISPAYPTFVRVHDECVPAGNRCRGDHRHHPRAACVNDARQRWPRSLNRASAERQCGSAAALPPPAPTRTQLLCRFPAAQPQPGRVIAGPQLRNSARTRRRLPLATVSRASNASSSLTAGPRSGSGPGPFKNAHDAGGPSVAQIANILSGPRTTIYGHIHTDPQHGARGS